MGVVARRREESSMKHTVWVLWLGSLAAIFLGSGWVVTAGQVAFWGTVVAHAVEFLVKRPVMAAAEGTMGQHFVQTMIYGMFHWKPLEDAARRHGGQPG